jgi:hypothetical protein
LAILLSFSQTSKEGTNHQIDAGDQPSFHQKQFSPFRLGIAFSMLPQLRLPHPPKRSAHSIASLRMDNLLEFQSTFMMMSMNQPSN